jgi:hypothetical protein
MKDGTPTILYTKETRERATCSVSTERSEQQSNRATERSAGHVTHRSAVLAAGRNERRCIQTMLPGASLHYPPLGLARSLSLVKEGLVPQLSSVIMASQDACFSCSQTNNCPPSA